MMVLKGELKIMKGQGVVALIFQLVYNEGDFDVEFTIISVTMEVIHAVQD